MFKKLIVWVLTGMLGLAYAGSALAFFHLWRINEIYSNSDGTVQFLELICSPSLSGCNDGEIFANGVTITVTPTGGSAGSPVTLTGTLTAPLVNKTLLLATPGFSAVAGVTPDYAIPVGFIAINGGTIRINNGSIDTVAYTALPTNGTQSKDRNGNVVTATPMNFAGVTGSFSPADTTPPSVPGGVTATAMSSSQINLSWTASTDNVGVAHYHVYRGGIQVATVTGSPPATSYSDTGLAAGTSYSYTVNACDAAENCSANSSPVSATTLAAGSASFTPLLRRGWNLLGNSLELTLNVATVFGTPTVPVTDVTTYVNSIWKWNATLGIWQFYAPNLTAQQNQDYADLNGFEVLASIEPGMGYWVNLKNSAPAGGVTLPAQSGAPVIYKSVDSITGTPARIAGRNLVTGWQLVAIADALTPSQFNENLGDTPPDPYLVKLSFQSLWAWDAVLGTWYFYAPQLHKDGVDQNVGLALVQQYALDNGFLHFEDYDKTLGIGTGFWIRR